MPSLPWKRKKPTLAERMRSCFYCNYPISQRHHALPVSVYGDTTAITELCANCHEAFHIFARAYEDILAHKEDTRSITLMLKLRSHWGRRDAFRVENLCMHVRQAYDRQHGITTHGEWENFFDAHDRREEERRWRLR